MLAKRIIPCLDIQDSRTVKGVNFVDELNGIFAFVLYDADKNTFFAARDHMGIIPLYMGWDANGTLYFAS